MILSSNTSTASSTTSVATSSSLPSKFYAAFTAKTLTTAFINVSIRRYDVMSNTLYIISPYKSSMKVWIKPISPTDPKPTTFTAFMNKTITYKEILYIFFY